MKKKNWLLALFFGMIGIATVYSFYLYYILQGHIWYEIVDFTWYFRLPQLHMMLFSILLTATIMLGYKIFKQVLNVVKF